jgi:hypothetical protein
MTIKVWYWAALQSSSWNDKKEVRVEAKHASLIVPGDFNVFIITTGSLNSFEEWCKQHSLKIHWKQPQPAYNYRYPTLTTPRLVTYVVVKEQ